MPKFVIFLTIIASVSVVFGLPPRQFDGIKDIRRAINNSIVDLDIKQQEAFNQTRKIEEKFTTKYYEFADRLSADMEKAIQKVVKSNNDSIKAANTTVDLSQCTKIITEIDKEEAFDDIEPVCYSMKLLSAFADIGNLGRDVLNARVYLENLTKSADECLNRTYCEYKPDMLHKLMNDLNKSIQRHLDDFDKKLSTTDKKLFACASKNGYNDFRHQLKNAKKRSKDCIKRKIAQNQA